MPLPWNLVTQPLDVTAPVLLVSVPGFMRRTASNLTGLWPSMISS